MKTLSRVYIVLIMLFLYAPLFIMVLFSFNSSNSTSVFEGFSLHWYTELIGNDKVLNALFNTLLLAVSSATIATILGSVAAVGIFSYKKKITKTAIMSVTNIPMMNPDIVTGISMMLLFVFIGKALGLLSVVPSCLQCGHSAEKSGFSLIQPKQSFWTSAISKCPFCISISINFL